MRRGFTLIEVIIVIGITAVLAGMVLTYTSSSRDQVSLYIEEAKLAQTISRAKALAITTFNKPAGQEQIPCGYGVHFDYDANAYALFAYNAESCNDITTLNPDGFTIVTTEILPKNISLDLNAANDYLIQDVLFIPPDPKTLIWDAGGQGDLLPSENGYGYVFLKTISGASSVKIAVNQGGQITF